MARTHGFTTIVVAFALTGAGNRDGHVETLVLTSLGSHFDVSGPLVAEAIFRGGFE